MMWGIFRRSKVYDFYNFDGGWHFSWLGRNSRFQESIKSSKAYIFQDIQLLYRRLYLGRIIHRFLRKIINHHAASAIYLPAAG
jgi:hypothetical protein